MSMTITQRVQAIRVVLLIVALAATNAAKDTAMDAR